MKDKLFADGSKTMNKYDWIYKAQRLDNGMTVEGFPYFDDKDRPMVIDLHGKMHYVRDIPFIKFNKGGNIVDRKAENGFNDVI